MSGPIPKREAERTRRNKEPEGSVSLAKGNAYPVTIPPADETWAPRAKSWYESLATSGMKEFMQNSDYEYARILCDALTDYYKRPSAMMLASILSGMTSLGTTEGDRRRMRIELEKPKPVLESASITAIGDYKSKLAGKK
jgi:hypothetical protein